VLGERTPTFEDLPRLKYTLMVFQEAMRLYPPAWAMSRAAIKADEIGGYRVPANSEILLIPYITQRHPKYWEKPEEFYPEHFLAEKSATRPRFAYFPFGGGPRQCIGNNFALMEAQLIIATVAQKYRLRLADELEIEPQTSLTLRPRGGVRMTLHRKGKVD
jgi:cytochrome P450